jgi:hypothetical protein
VQAVAQITNKEAATKDDQLDELAHERDAAMAQTLGVVAQCLISFEQGLQCESTLGSLWQVSMPVLWGVLQVLQPIF